ncbi:hypothetical protein LOTGIDRAFT_169670 [Lottia gigantea]|uniref:Arrestin C-terminal-like domain-containing protein n=1 Tax=Lottia gigantea TaxID=225164 RepID=V3ZQ86_LOTGI|nr:hypothetical protein LOTGIDRAFT_169670 [Lottia gigantea]ESO83041.1 hypothetical protein LOTGIDRAFT_169670 [Lottia gigantea]
MKVQKFEVNFSNREGVFITGANVEGHVFINLKQSVTLNNGLRLYIGGKGHCRKFPGQRRNKRVQYFADVHYLSVNLELIPQGKHLNQGDHHIFFSANLPSSIPSSFEGSHGYIRYYCEAMLSTQGESDQREAKNFTLIHHIDLDKVPAARVPIKAEDNEYIQGLCCGNVGEYTVKLDVDKTGYVPGEEMYYRIRLMNASSLSTRSVSLILRQITTYKGYEDGKKSGQESTDVQIQIFTLFENQVIVQPGENKQINNSATMPCLPPTKLVDCDIIDIKYNLVLTVPIPTAGKVEIIRVIIIGTMPVRPVIQPSDHHPTSTSPQHFDEEPPTYEECVYGGPSGHSKGHASVEWRPRFPYYRSLSKEGAMVQLRAPPAREYLPPPVFPPGDNWV